jgi:hypothetical protein
MENYEAMQQVVVAAYGWKPPFTMYVDKIPGFWVVTGCPDDRVTLRLRIEYWNAWEPFNVFCEVRESAQGDFTLVGPAESCLYEIVDECRTSFLDEEGGPQLWTEEFECMARRWAVACCILEFGEPRFADFVMRAGKFTRLSETGVH